MRTVLMVLVVVVAGCASEVSGPFVVEQPSEPTQAELADRCGMLGQWSYTRVEHVGSCGLEEAGASGPFAIEVVAAGDVVEVIDEGPAGSRGLGVVSFDGEACELGLAGPEYADPVFHIQGEELMPSLREGREFRAVDYALLTFEGGRAEVVETLMVAQLLPLSKPVAERKPLSQCFQQFLATAERAPWQ